MQTSGSGFAVSWLGCATALVRETGNSLVGVAAEAPRTPSSELARSMRDVIRGVRHAECDAGDACVGSRCSDVLRQISSMSLEHYPVGVVFVRLHTN